MKFLQPYCSHTFGGEVEFAGIKMDLPEVTVQLPLEEILKALKGLSGSDKFKTWFKIKNIDIAVGTRLYCPAFAQLPRANSF